MKRILKNGISVLLAILCAFNLAVVSFAEETVTSGFCGENVTWSFNEGTGTLTVSGTGAMRSYGIYLTPWYDLSNSIKTVVIEEGITSVGQNLFHHFQTMRNLTLPSTLKSIESYAFAACLNLYNIYYNGSLSDWCEIDFADENSNPFRFSDNFYIQGDLLPQEITVPNGITVLDNDVFRTSDIVSLTISEGVTRIGDNAFHGSISLSNVVISDTVNEIGTDAFYNCPNNLVTYYTGTEEQWNEIDIASGNDALTKNVVFNYGKPTDACGENATWAFDETSGALTINGTGEIDANFANWDQIKDQVTYVEVENGITSVGESAFVDFTALQEVYFSESVLTVGADAFSGCENLAIVTILADNVSLANSAFKNTDSRLFFVVKSGSQSHSAVAGAGYAVTPFSVGTEEVMENLKTLVFEGRFVFYESLDYNYISKLMLNLPDLYYVKFEKMVLDGVMSLPDFSVDLEIPEENIEPDEEYLTLKDVYISVMIDGEKVSFEELRERVTNGDYSGFIFTNYVEDGVNNSFFESVAEFFGQLEESLQGTVEFVVAAFNAFITTVSKIWKKMFG